MWNMISSTDQTISIYSDIDWGGIESNVLLYMHLNAYSIEMSLQYRP